MSIKFYVQISCFYNILMIIICIQTEIRNVGCLCVISPFLSLFLLSLIKHLKMHIRGGVETRCPFRGCDCKFTHVMTFASHISTKHRCAEDSVLDDFVLDKSVATELRDDLLTLFNRGRLSTEAKRKAAFKECCNYVHPVPLLLGNDENDKECFP